VRRELQDRTARGGEIMENSRSNPSSKATLPWMATPGKASFRLRRAPGGNLMQVIICNVAANSSTCLAWFSKAAFGVNF